MGTTPVFGFPYPDPSDLVANYPALGQQLAEDVEDEIIASGGLSHINTTTFSAVSSVSINNVFTSTYDNYKVILKSTQTVADNLFIRFRVGGSDNTTSNYTYYQFRGSGGSTLSQSITSDTQQIDPVGGTGRKYITIDFFDPAPALFTGYNIVAGNQSTLGVGLFFGQFGASTAFDGFSMYPTTGTITGTIRVYGYKNS